MTDERASDALSSSRGRAGDQQRQKDEKETYAEGFVLAAGKGEGVEGGGVAGGGWQSGIQEAACLRPLRCNTRWAATHLRCLVTATDHTQQPVGVSAAGPASAAAADVVDLVSNQSNVSQSTPDPQRLND